MRNSNLIVIVLVSLIAGYFAYPYFNQSKENSENISKTSKTEESSARKATNKNEVNSPPEELITEPTVSETTTLPNEDSTEQTDQSKAQQATGTEIENNSSSNSQNGISFRGQTPTTTTIRDFSFYTLKKSPNRLEISNSDPRILLIKGSYRGFFDGNAVELEINRNRSSLHFTNNEDLSYSAQNDLFFSNVNENGNTLLIDNGKTKIFVDISKWPTIELNFGKNTKIFLR